ncbi:GNAT family N-acetyltransferase [Halanaerobacter jeridensis]|uniref:Ribosomal-protein-alanine N-acetyltransferase n=1 Tax=Halanaerobacter jeridensis TaxID=706427 RepID=A0A938XNQ8_9FIRM|nr:GNAT family protein [Halanaerobacter jeridensis]MBM7556153.1 ribosomal-protein-alanine N-acetyltransferase [Halanaerobacter jeridensis]
MLRDKVFAEFPELETERLRLRKLKLSDAEELFKVFSNPKVMKYYNLYPFDSLAQAKELIRNYSDGFEEQRVLRWGLEHKEKEKIIGSCGIYDWREHFCRATVGYELGTKYWEQGFMSETLTEIIRFGFRRMRLNRIQALVEPPNEASRQLLTSMGFKEEGLLRNYMFYKGEYKDLIMYSLLRKDFVLKCSWQD